MGGKGELVRYIRLRAPKDPKEKGKNGNSMTYEELKKEICDLIDTASQTVANISVIALVEAPDDE